jgi:very-short-patch-repair endonuclease
MNAREEAGFNRHVSSTWIETWVYNTLDDMGILFDKEVSVGKYRVDVVVDEGTNAPYALELDGDYYHKETFKNHPAEGDLDYQSERDTYINNQGYHVIRVWESDIENFPFINPNKKSVNLSVELLNYTPIEIKELIKLLQNKERYNTIQDAI